MNTISVDEQVSLIHVNSLPYHSVSTHLTLAVVAFARYPSARQLSVLRSRLRQCTASSSKAPGRIEFVILRTGCSLLAAPHDVSPRRSCIRLRAGERLPGEDLHPSDY
jgi:hypothetical protein